MFRYACDGIVRGCSAAVIAVALSTELLGQAPQVGSPVRIEANRNTTAAGRFENGVLTLRLNLVQSDWYPEADHGPSMPVYAFAEEGRSRKSRGHSFECRRERRFM